MKNAGKNSVSRLRFIVIDGVESSLLYFMLILEK